jgi:hypothetical protein
MKENNKPKMYYILSARLGKRVLIVVQVLLKLSRTVWHKYKQHTGLLF